MKANNYAFFDTTGKVTEARKSAGSAAAPSLLRGQTVGRDYIIFSLSLAHPSSIGIRIATVSGRTVFTAQRQGLVSGLQTVRFPAGAIARGAYCVEVTAAGITERFAAVVR